MLRSLLCNQEFYAKVGGDGLPEYVFTSADQHIAATKASTLDAELIIHRALAPEITITGPDTATGVWTLHDIVKTPQFEFEGHCHYFENYRKEDGQWKVSRIEYKKRAHFAFEKTVIPIGK